MRKRVENATRDANGKIVYPYDPAPGGRIEIRFRQKEDREDCNKALKSLREKTGLAYYKIITEAVKELDKKYDERGNKI